MCSDHLYLQLGYNGSGKTSLMECLMGIQTLTSGQVLINGIDTKENPVAALHNVGICPKFDGACRSLTVLENLLIFCRIKGLTALEASCDAKDIMIQLGLTDWAHFRIKSLPSGLQRKVSVAIAFCGGSDVVLLDQPSKGMDLKSASELWHNIGIMKKGKTIVFTTHSVEEAESQADRIGIMAAGTLQCLGSNIFLRKYLGSGYTLSISSQYRNSDAGNGRITVAISQNVKGAQLVSCHGGELIFTLPQQIAAEFQDIFKWIERHKHELGIKDYTLTPSRLVDVFLRTIREHDQALGRTPKPLQPIPEFQRERVSVQSQSSMIMLFLFIYLRSDFSYMISFFPPLIVLVIAALIPPLLQVSIILFCISVSGTLQASHLRIQMDVVGLSPLAYWFTCIVWNFLLLFVPFCVFLAVLLTFSGSQHIMWLLTAPCLCFASTAYACFLRVVAFRVSSFSIQYSLLIIPMAVFSFFFVARYSPIRLACYIFHPAMFVFALESETDMLLSCSTVNLILAALGFFLYSLCFVEHCLYIYQGASLWANRSKQPQLMTTHNFGENVTDEIERVRNTPDDLLQLRRVSRLSGNKVAIREVTVGIHGGSSVGFLGANGSGKTSMIECLLGQAAPDFGSAHVTGFDVAKSPIAARSRVGYAAQFDDALILSLSARQQLHLYARVVGIPEVVCEDVVTRMIDGVGLIHGADRPSGTYSSGMKRKLSVAMALIGQRPVVLMDQPTTGVDPASRRHMWAIIDEVRSDPNRCVLLTTHALDETEALCDRIVFFVNGEVKFIGSPNQLRAKFSLQYRVEISFDLPKDVSQIRGWILETFPGATVAEINERRIRVHVPKAAVNSVAILYSTLHSDHGLPITDVTVGADSLDEIMMSVAEQSAMGNTLVSVLPST
uniref:ABC transporter domain-containing protein n=2 Tax=Spongospora subterranea TaxID=70186 RepID=A0A0H5R5F7_9EUKA|eukprot:CRZ03399.1 hypothetical protein [Spongospora subterranea]